MTWHHSTAQHSTAQRSTWHIVKWHSVRNAKNRKNLTMKLTRKKLEKVQFNNKIAADLVLAFLPWERS